MKHKKVKIIAVFLLGLGLTGLKAQEAVSASGGNATGGGGSASYTIGQVAYTNISGVAGKVTQGVQQPYEIFVITSIEEAKGINLICSVYPNPATGYVKLIIENFELSNLSFHLYGIKGNILENKKVTSNETIISLGNLTPATYFLKVYDNNKEVKTFKIIKN